MRRTQLRNFKKFYFDAYNDYYGIDLNPFSDIDTHIFYKYYANENKKKLCRCNNKEEEEKYIFLNDSDFSDSD